MTSHEVAEADANLRIIAELRGALDVAIGENEQRVVVERQLRIELEALRQLDQLDQALAAMTVAEIDSARARIDTDLVPQLARMLAICLLKEDGTPYNHVTWALGPAEPFGAMELILQRIEGKSPTQIRIEAESKLDQARPLITAVRDYRAAVVGLNGIMVAEAALWAALDGYDTTTKARSE